jgi:plastocyanin
MMNFGGVWFVLVVVLVPVLVGVAVAFAVGSGARDQDSGRAHDVLRQRLAAGEIGPEEYREKVELLGSAGDTGGALRGWLPAALIGLVVLVLIGLLVAGTGRPDGGWWGPRGGHMDAMMGQRTSQGTAPDAVADADEITIEAGDMWFEPDVIEVAAGEPVNLTVTNVGQVFHDLTIDELDLQIDVEPGQTATAGLEDLAPGEYAYYCSVSGHASTGMQGTLTVVEP